MGNCCDRCFGRFSKRKYLRTRYNVERDFSIEFENLMDDENHQEEISKARLQIGGPFTVSSYMRWRQYGTLIDEQSITDQKIEAQLVQQEEELRREEEAYYEAKRAAAQAAKVQKLWEQAGKTNNAIMLKNGPKGGWVGEDESDWDIAGGEDDFEMFLENVKARSLAARNRALPYQVPVDQQSTSSLTSKDRTDDQSSIDLEWEHEAGMQPPPKKEAKKRLTENPALLAELAVKPMLSLKNTHEDDFSNDFEWDSDIGGGGDNSSDQNSESRTLLSNSTETVER